MNILGLSDGPSPSAALVVDDQVVAVVDDGRLRRRSSGVGVPWAAAEAALSVAGLQASDVDMVGVAGRFSPPFFLRRHPGLRRLARDAFSPLLDVQVFYQAVLRQSGVGALEAARTADWFDAQLRERGFGMRRTILVDVHRCLAEAAHRTSGMDPVLVVTVHPSGDGVGVAVYRGSAGQLDRLWAQKGFASLHVHLGRCVAAMGLGTDLERVWRLARTAAPDPELTAHLDRLLHAEGPALSRKRYPFPERRSDYAPVGRVPVPVAAASLQENLGRAIGAVVHTHAARTGLRSVALGGAVFDDPALVRRIAGTPGIDAVHVSPVGAGYAALALGAAVSLAGSAPTDLRGPGLGAAVDAGVAAACVGAAAAHADPRGVASLLEAGAAVARCVGRGGFGRSGGGTRSVMCVAGAVAHAAAALGRDPLDAEWLTLAAGPRFGDTPIGLRPVRTLGPGEDRELEAVLRHLGDRGHAGVALLPLASADEPAVERAEDAWSVFERSTLEALWLGPFLVRR